MTKDASFPVFRHDRDKTHTNLRNRQLFDWFSCRRSRRGCREGGHRLAFANDSDAVDGDGGGRFVGCVAIDACDGGDEEDAMGVALAEDGVLAVELGHGLLGDEKLAAVSASAGGSGAGVGHGEATGLVEGEARIDLVLEEVARVAGAVAHAVPALNHEVGDDAVEGGAVVEGLVMHLLHSLGIGPVFRAFGETGEVGYGDGGLLIVELAGEAAHGGVDNCGGTGRHDGRRDLAGGTGGVWELVGRRRGGGCGLGLRRDAEDQKECEITKRHAGHSSMEQAISDGRLEQFAGVSVGEATRRGWCGRSCRDTVFEVLADGASEDEALLVAALCLKYSMSEPAFCLLFPLQH